MGQWKLVESKKVTIYDNYSKAREAYIRAYQKNKKLNKPVEFRKIA